MTGAHTVKLALWCAGLIAVMAGLSLLKGGLFADRYEGDMLHLTEIILRVADGQWPHLDFMTPIGMLAFWPIAVFVKAGVGFGTAVHLGQLSLALALAPLAVWVALSRFRGQLAYLYILLVMTFALALVHGESIPNISISMHYNRWAWALAFIMLPVGMLPPLRRSVAWDAAALGLPMAALALIKVTYVVALAPGLIVLLIARGQWAALGWGVAVTLAALAVFTGIAGVGIWPAYAQDVLTTASSDIRTNPGLALDQVVTGPLFIGGHLAALAAVVFLRQSGFAALGLGLLCLVPGFVYVTYQNFGNDPQWMLVTALVVLMTLPAAGTRNPWGWDLRLSLGMVGAALLVASLPSFFNLAYSPLRHFSETTEDFTTVFPRSDQHDDFFTDTRRVFQVNLQIAGEDVSEDLQKFASLAERPDLTIVGGEEIAECSLHNGLVAWFDTAARQLEEAGIGPDARVLVADLLSALWMYSDDLQPLKGGAPWRYGGAPGIEDAQMVLVPLCAVNSQTRADIVKAIDEMGYALRERLRTDLFILYDKQAEADQIAANTR